MTILGLDISTSITGIALLEPSDDEIPNIVLLDHIHFKKCNTIWEKVDRVKDYFENASQNHKWTNIEAIYAEDALKKFSVGKSSASTIATTGRFNGLVSYVARNQFELDPVYISSGAARKACGLKMQQKKKCGGLTHKEQTFKAMMESDLSHITWPNKLRSKNIVDYAYDIVDAYVISKAGLNIYHTM